MLDISSHLASEGNVGAVVILLSNTVNGLRRVVSKLGTPVCQHRVSKMGGYRSLEPQSLMPNQSQERFCAGSSSPEPLPGTLGICFGAGHL